MQKTYNEQMLWGNTIEIIKTIKMGLEYDDVEMKQLCLSIILGHFTKLIQEMELLPETLRISTDYKIILQELCLAHL